MALKLNFREVTPEDTEILRMIALRNGKAEDYLCCDVTNEDGVTQTTWYSKADVALWGEDYIRAHTTMKYSDYSGWIIILDMEPWNDAQASPRKKKKRDSFPQIPTWLEGHVKERKQKRLLTVTLCSSAGNELLEVWYYGDLITVKGDKRVDLKEFRKKNNTRPLRFASENDLMDILGLIPGAVTPLGILNDEERKVQVFLDREFLEGRKLIGVHPNENTATVWLKTEDLLDIIKEHGNPVQVLEL